MANPKQRFGVVGALLIAASVALRWSLCLSGGQFFMGDENRYERVTRLYLALAHGNWADVRAVASQPEHALFPWIGAGLTVLQHAAAQATRYGDWSHWENIEFTLPLAACILSLFSVLNIYLVFRLALRAGAGRREALWAAGLMAASNTNLYYCRHLLQYDAALSIALGSLVMAVGQRSPRRLCAVGLLAAAAYETYNGYWFMVPLAALAASLTAPRESRLSSLLWVAAGSALGAAALVLLGVAAGGLEYLRVMSAFSRTVTQGLFAEGWSLPWEFLGKAEGPLGMTVALLIVGFLLVDRYKRRPLEERTRLWILLLGFAYAALVVFSVVLGKFVVYGRTTKALVPLLCLLGAWAVDRLSGARRIAQIGTAVVMAVSLLGAFSLHLARVYPREVEIAVLKKYGNPKRTLSVSGSIYQVLVLPVTRPDLVLVNAQLLYPIRGVIGVPPGVTLLRVAHALSYEPYQYEGFTPYERRALRTSDISVRLIALSDPASVPNDLPLSQRYNLSDRPTGR